MKPGPFPRRSNERNGGAVRCGTRWVLRGWGSWCPCQLLSVSVQSGTLDDRLYTGPNRQHRSRARPRRRGRRPPRGPRPPRTRPQQGGGGVFAPGAPPARLSGPDVFRRLSLSGHPIYMCRELSSVRVLSSLSDTRRVSISRHWSLARRNPPRYYWYVCRTRDGPP